MTKTKIEVVLINGVVLVKRSKLMDILGVTKQAIVNYESTSRYTSPLRRIDKTEYELGSEKDIYYNLMEALVWHKNEPNHKYGSKQGEARGLVGVSVEDDDYKSGDTITSKNAKKAKELEEAKLKLIDREISDIKLKEATGEYIRADDVDKITTEMTVILLSAWRSLLDTLPVLLVSKTQKEIHTILDTEFEAEIHILDRKLNEA